MPDTAGDPLQTALAYHRAWTGHDFDAAMRFIAADVVCRAPAGLIEGAEQFRAFMEPFSRMVTRSELLAAFGDQRSAVLIYHTETVPVPDAPGAERLTVVDGLIVEIRIIFDRLPFTLARQSSQP